MRRRCRDVVLVRSVRDALTLSLPPPATVLDNFRIFENTQVVAPGPGIGSSVVEAWICVRLPCLLPPLSVLTGVIVL